MREGERECDRDGAHMSEGERIRKNVSKREIMRGENIKRE